MAALARFRTDCKPPTKLTPARIAPDGALSVRAALRILRQQPGAKLVLSAGEYFVVPGGRVATANARKLIRRHLTVIDHGLFVGHPQSWAYPRNPPIKRYRVFLRAVGKRIARRGRDPSRRSVINGAPAAQCCATSASPASSPARRRSMPSCAPIK
jgi:hypothetical protein